MKSALILLSMLLFPMIGFSQQNPAMDKYLGCYKTLEISGNKIKDPKHTISYIDYVANAKGYTMIDPKTNKPLPHYKLRLDSGYPMGDGKNYVFWNAAFLDRGKFFSGDHSLGYTFEGQIKLLSDELSEGFSMITNFLYNFEIKELSNGQIQVRTELTDIGMGSDCRDHYDCKPVGAIFTLQKSTCK